MQSTPKPNKNKLSSRSVLIVALLSLAMTAQSCSFSSGSGPKGVWKSTDSGLSWVKVNNVVKQGEKKTQPLLDSVDVHSIVVAPDNNDVLYAATSGGIFATDKAGEVWHHVLQTGDMREVKVSNVSPEVVYAVGNSEGRAAVYKSVNRGKTWEQKFVEANDNFAWSASVNPRDAQNLLVGFQSGLLLNSTDGGQSWIVMQNFNGAVRQIAHHPYDPRVVYALIREKGMFVSRDGGNNFVPLTDNISKRAQNGLIDYSTTRRQNPRLFVSFDFNCANTDIVYLTTDAGMFKSLNGGGSWVDLQLPVDPTNAKTIGLDTCISGNLVYTSIDTVVYRSSNGGQSFTTTKLPTNRLIRSLQVVPGNPEIIYAGLIGL